MTGPEVREIARRLLDRAQRLELEALSARASSARRAAVFLEEMGAGLREDALRLARGFPAASDLGPDDPTPAAR